MKVEELIEELCKYNRDAEVTTPYSETIRLSYIYMDCEGNPLDQSETPLVFIEGCDINEEDC